LFNDNRNQQKTKLCIHRGKGKYPFIIKPKCTDEQENIIIEPKGNLTLTYNNPYKNADDDNSVYYISIFTDSKISFSYKYEREIFLDENIYYDLNHKGNKKFKLSKKINQKKSIYYQINLCGNKYQNPNLLYKISNSDKIPVKHDIYQEFPLDTIKSYQMDSNMMKKMLDMHNSIDESMKQREEEALSLEDQANELLTRARTLREKNKKEPR